MHLYAQWVGVWDGLRALHGSAGGDESQREDVSSGTCLELCPASLPAALRIKQKWSSFLSRSVLRPVGGVGVAGGRQWLDPQPHPQELSMDALSKPRRGPGPEEFCPQWEPLSDALLPR